MDLKFETAAASAPKRVLKEPSKVGKGAWALADQASVSLGNFLITILLARTIAPTEYGDFALLFGTIVFLNTIHAAVVTYPLCVKGASAGSELSRSYAGISLVTTLVLAVPQAMAVLAAGLVLRRLDLVPWAAISLVAWQLQETTRTALISQLRYQTAIWGDAVSYLGQALLAFILVAAYRLSLPSVFVLMALTSLAGSFIQYRQARIFLPSTESSTLFIKEAWAIGKWMILCKFTGFFTVQAFSWTLAWRYGSGSVAVFQSVVNILALTNPLVFTANSLIVTTVASTYRLAGALKAMLTGLHYAAYSLAALVPYYFALLTWPSMALLIFYGKHSSYVAPGVAPFLQLLVTAYFLEIIAMTGSAILAGMEMSREVFFIQLAGMLTALFIGLPIAGLYGIRFAIIGLIAVNAIRSIVAIYLAQTVARGEDVGTGNCVPRYLSRLFGFREGAGDLAKKI